MSGSPILQPDVSITLASALLDVQNSPQRVLLVGQKTAAGSAVSGVLIQNLASAGAPENALFGANSMLAEMVRGVRKVNRLTQVDCIPISDNGGGVFRTLTFTILGTATAAGTARVIVGSSLNYTFDVAIASGATPTTIAAAIVAAINANTKCPYTAANVAGAVTLTAVHRGTVHNSIGCEVTVAAAGVTLSPNVAQGVAGSVDPVLTGILDVATSRYQTIVWPWSVLTVLQAFLGPRFNASNAVLDGAGLTYTSNASVSTILTTLNALNDQNVVAFVDKEQAEQTAGAVSGYLGPAMQEISFVKLAYFAGIRALRLTPDAPIDRFVTSPASLDQFGGPALASLPYFNTSFPDLPVIGPNRGFTAAEIEQITTAGGAVLGVNRTGTGVIAGEVPTTYKTDAAANPDATFKFLEYVDTESNAREYFFNNLRSRFAQSRLTQGAIARGRDMANAVVIRAYCEKLYQDLAGPDFVLVQDGEAAFKFYKENLTVTLDLALGKVTLTMLVPIVTQLRTIIATMRISFTTTA
jgi:phage tail sheath gpL-like